MLRLGREDVDDGVTIQLNIHGRQLRLPPKLGYMVRRLRDQDEPRGMLQQLGSTTSWLIPGQSPARPLSAQQLGNTLRQHGLGGLAARNTAHLALAADLPASVLADLTGTSVENAVHWTAIAKRDWGDYIASRAHDRL